MKITVWGAPTCPLVREPGDPCPHILEGVITVLGRSWAMVIIGTLGNFDHLRFNELKTKLGHISPKTLAARLRNLQDKGLIERESYNEIPPRVEYELSAKGRALNQALRPLLSWAQDADHE